MLAGDQLGQIAGLLVGVAVAAYLIDAEIGMGAVAQAHRGRAAADFLHGDDMLEIAQAGAAVGLGHGDAEQAQIAELAPQITGEFIVGVNRRGARRDLVGGEAAHGIADHVGGLAEAEIEGGKLVADHGRL